MAEKTVNANAAALENAAILLMIFTYFNDLHLPLWWGFAAL